LQHVHEKQVGQLRSLFADVRFWPKAEFHYVAFDVAFGGKADMSLCAAHVCF